MQKVFSILLLLYNVSARAQDPILYYADIDSLRRAETQAKEDTSKIILYANLAIHYLYARQDSGLFYITKGLELARRLQYIKGEAYLLTEMGEIMAMQGNLSKGLELKLEALRKAEPLKDSFLLTFCYNFIGANYLGTQDFETALVYYNKLKAFTQLRQGFLKIVYAQLGSCYLGLNKLDSAYHYTKLAYDLDLKDVRHYSRIYENMGHIEARRGNYNKALQFFRMEGAILNGPSSGLVSTFQKMGQRDSALFYAKRMLTYKDPSFSYKLEATGLLASLYKSTGQIDSAFKYQELMLALKDSAYSLEKVKQVKSLQSSEQLRQFQLEQQQKEIQQQYKARIRYYSLAAGLAVLSITAILLYRNNKHKQRSNALLQQKNEQIENALSELKATQAQLIQKEKMASLGELTAGIAHEIQNPLNFVNNFSELSIEQVNDLEQAALNREKEEVNSVATDLRDNLTKVVHHGKRAEAIVKSMLEHSRSSKGEKQPTDLNALVEEYVRLSYHGLRAKDKSFDAGITLDLDNNMSRINIVPQEIGRVLLNLFNNAFYTVFEKKRKSREDYKPMVTVITKRLISKIELRFVDNGNGIPQAAIDKVFQPFFTTKPTGEGTGLGLSLSYDIIKAHGGELKVESKEGEGSIFSIVLPVL
jgi:signal transduction histidine kinase